MANFISVMAAFVLHQRCDQERVLIALIVLVCIFLSIYVFQSPGKTSFSYSPYLVPFVM